MKKYRFFGSFLDAQEDWLNKMSAQGYRLIRVGKLLYEFESCTPDEVQYHVEFIGEKSHDKAEDYKRFLEELGYRVFYKNINLGYSIGKLRYRPWAEKGGRIATKSTTYDREVLIVEKSNDGDPFDMHTSKNDIIWYYSKLRNPWLWFFVIFGVMGFIFKSIICGAFALAALIPIILYQSKIGKIKKEKRLEE